MTAPDVVVIGGTLSTKEPDQAVVQWLRRLHPRAPDIHCQAVLIAFHFLPDNLRANRTETAAVAHA